MPDRKLNVEEITNHSSPEDCWIVVDGNVWDITAFAPSHPGGSGIIYKYAGCDATKAYSEIHAPSVIIDELGPSHFKGTLDTSTITEEWVKLPPTTTPERKLAEKPPLATIISCPDFEVVAEKMLSKKTWAFYSSAATDCITRDANKSMLDRVWFRPRLMRNVRHVSARSRMLGCHLQMPVFIAPAAMAKMVHPDGEKAMAKACASKGIVQCISSNASFPVAEIIEETPESHPTFFQLYVNSDRPKTEALLGRIMDLRPRIRGIFITIDVPHPGKREADERLKADESTAFAPNSGGSAKNDARGGGLGRLMGAYIDPSLAWEDLTWIRKLVGPNMPLVIKGIQTAADARLAVKAGMQGIVVSNHGGRSLDGMPPAILTLLELRRCSPEVFDKLEVYVDGGIRRGTDVMKCLCLGATAVGLGRPFLYSLTYGQDGVEHLIDILQDELETTMRLIGITDISQAHPGLLNTMDIDHMIPTSIQGHPYARLKGRARL